jgi:glycosyltransferase involved in cell wall biosynthesis
LKNLSLLCSNAIITVSNRAKQELIDNLNLSSKKIYSIHLGVNKDTEKTNFIKKKYFLYVANSASHHNHTILLNSFRNYIKSINKEYHLYLVMDIINKEQYKTLYKLILELEIEENVKIIPPMPKKTLNKYYRDATLYLFPSLSETFGMTTLEAMACGAPVLCSNISAMPEVNGDAAIYFNPMDINDIVEKINLVLEDKILYNKMIEKGYQRIKKFTWENTASQTLNLFENLVRNT